MLNVVFKNMNDLLEIPGIGKSIKKDLEKLGIQCVEDLKNNNAQKLYEKLCEIEGKKLDPCLLYTFRCAVYYASNKNHDNHKLKWWYWKNHSI
jgi:hypothetical protein